MESEARPVRSCLNSACSASMAPCIRRSMSLMTSRISTTYLVKRGLSLIGDQRADVLAQDRASDIALLTKGENVDRDLAVAREINRRRVHDLESLFQHLLIGSVRDFFGRVGELLRIGGVNAVDFGRFENDLAV